MSRDISPKEVQELLAQGYDPELIAFEFKLNIEDIKRLSNKPENKPTNRQKKAGEQGPLSEEQLAKIVQKMRENYRDVFTPKQVVKAPKKPMLPKQKEIVEDVIEKIEKIISDVEAGNRVEYPRLFAQTRRFKDYDLELDQILKIYNLLCTRQIKSIIKYEDSFNVINAIKSSLITKLAYAVNTELEQTKTSEELRKIESMILDGAKDVNNFTYTEIKRKIGDKRAEINQRQMQKSEENNSQETIQQIARDIIKGQFDMEKIEDKIRLEIQKRMKEKKNNPFALNEEQERKNVIFELKSEVIKRAEEYNMQDANSAIKQMKSIFGNNAIKIVIEMLIKRKEYNRAREVCDTILENTQDIAELRQIDYLRNHIVNSEISSRAIEQMEKNDATESEDAEFIKWLFNKLKLANLKPQDVTLGNGQRSLATILNRKIVENTIE